MRWRLWGSVVAALACTGFVAGIGLAGSPAGVGGCPATTGPAPGWTAIFARSASRTQADALLQQVERAGFKGAVVEGSCRGDWEIVLRGICPLATARALQQEARRATYRVVLEYKRPIDNTGDYEAVFGHYRNRLAAETARDRAATKNFRAVIEQDAGCGNDWEVEVAGIQSESQGNDFAAEARRSGFDVILEGS